VEFMRGRFVFLQVWLCLFRRHQSDLESNVW
jgi:hypothetical protein